MKHKNPLKRILDALHIAETQMKYSLKGRIQQPIEKEANLVILGIITDAIYAGYNLGCECDCHPVPKKWLTKPTTKKRKV